jgi:HKD family nuclease
MPTRSTTRIDLIDNSGPNKLLPYLRAAGASCRQVDIAVAFITAAGLESLLHLLKQVASKGRVRILTGIYQGFTDPKALAVLLREQSATGARLAVRISHDPRFHWKTYLLTGTRSATAIIGSSNMTSEGLAESGELNLVLTTRHDAKDFRRIRSAFEKQWDNRATLLSEQFVSQYRAWHRKQEPTTRRKMPLKQLLGTVPSGVAATSGKKEKQYWRLSCVGTLETGTIDLLEDITDWDERGLETLSTFTSLVRAGDEAVMFDTQSSRLSLVEVVDDTHTPRPTPDGRYFIAYRVKPKSIQKRLTTALWKHLRKEKLIRTKREAMVRGKMSKRKYLLFEELLSKR